MLWWERLGKLKWRATLVLGSLRRILKFVTMTLLTVRFCEVRSGLVEFCWFLRSATCVVGFLHRFLEHDVCLR